MKKQQFSPDIQILPFFSHLSTSETDLECSINIDPAAPHHLLLHLPNEDHFDHDGADHLPPPPLTLPLHLPLCRLPPLLQHLQADVWRQLQGSLVRNRLLGVEGEQLEAGVH